MTVLQAQSIGIENILYEAEKKGSSHLLNQYIDKLYSLDFLSRDKVIYKEEVITSTFKLLEKISIRRPDQITLYNFGRLRKIYSVAAESSEWLSEIINNISLLYPASFFKELNNMHDTALVKNILSCLDFADNSHPKMISYLKRYPRLKKLYDNL